MIISQPFEIVLCHSRVTLVNDDKNIALASCSTQQNVQYVTHFLATFFDFLFKSKMIPSKQHMALKGLTLSKLMTVTLILDSIPEEFYGLNGAHGSFWTKMRRITHLALELTFEMSLTNIIKRRGPKTDP